MPLIYDEKYVNILYIPERKTLKVIWKGEVSSPNYHDTFDFVMDFLSTNNVENYLTDSTNQGLISPKDRQWFQDTVVPHAVKHGMKRAAIVVGKDVFKKYYFETIKKTTVQFGMEMRYFPTVNEAEAWIEEDMGL